MLWTLLPQPLPVRGCGGCSPSTEAPSSSSRARTRAGVGLSPMAVAEPGGALAVGSVGSVGCVGQTLLSRDWGRAGTGF